MCYYSENLISIPEITTTLNFKDFPNANTKVYDKIFV